MVKRRHEFWNLVTELGDGNRVECNYCAHKFYGTIARITRHFSGVKRNGIEICESVPPDVREKAESELNKPASKKARITASSTIEDDSLSCSKDVQKDVKPEIVPVLDDKKTLADKNLVKFLFSCRIPFDVVEDPCFADYIRSVAECGGGYKLPTTSMLETTFCSQNPIVEKYVQDVKQSWAKTGCTVMVEAWRNSITITAYAQKGVVFIKSYDDPNNGKPNIDVKDIVGSAIDDIGSEHVVQVIGKRDTLFFDPVSKMLAEKYPRIYMNPCVSHEIHSLLKNIYDAVEWVKITFDKVVSVIKDVTRDAHILSLMREYTSISGELQHANSVSGSFASKYPMVCLIVKNKGGLDQLVASREWKMHFDKNSEMAKPFAEFIQNGVFWSHAEDLLKVMEPIVRVLRLVEDDRSTSGYLYEAMKSAEEEIKELCSSNNQMNKYQKILDVFQDRRKHIVCPMHEVAAFLNPYYMRQRIFPDQNSGQMQRSNEFLLKTVVSEDERELLRTELLLYREQTSKLFTEVACGQLKKYHPVTWWEQYGGRLSVLKKHAMRILGQPCKCSSRLKYNAVELVQNMKMKTGNPDTRNMIMNIKMNEMLMERYQRLGEKNLGEKNLFPILLPDYYVAHDHKGWGDDDDYADNCKDSDKADGAGQTGLGVEPLAGDHAIVKSDVSSCKDGGGEKKNISDTFAQLKDFLPGCQLPDVGKMNSDFQDLQRWFQVLLMKVDAKKWALNPAEASQQKEGANLRLDSDIVEPIQGMIVEDQSKRKAYNQNMQGATTSLGPLELISPTLQGEFGKSAAAYMSHPSGESGYTGQAPQSGGSEHEKHWLQKGVGTNASSPSGNTLENHGASSTMHARAIDQNGTLLSGSQVQPVNISPSIQQQLNLIPPALWGENFGADWTFC